MIESITEIYGFDLFEVHGLVKRDRHGNKQLYYSIHGSGEIDW